MRRFWLPAAAVGALFLTTGTVGADIPPTAPSAFQQPSMERTAGLGPQAIVAADVDGDGFVDIVVANYLSDDVSIIFGSAAGILPDAPVTIPVLSGPSAVQVADMNHDGLLDIVVAHEIDSEVAVLLQSAGRNFEVQQGSPTGNDNGPYGLAVADFNGDGKLDAVTANYLDFPVGTVSLLSGHGDGTFSQLPATVFTGSDLFGPMALVTADVNGDHKPDLIVANTDGDDVVVLLGNGDGTFMPSQDLTTGFGPFSLAVADMNIDGKPDLVVSNTDDSTVATFLGHGDGMFNTVGSVVQLEADAFPQGVNVWDFNLDGRPDIAVANTFVSLSGQEGVTVIRGNGDGTFQPLTAGDDFVVGGDGPCAVTSGDLNGDHTREIVTANMYATDETTAVSLLVNEGHVLAGDADANGVVEAADLTQATGELFDVGGSSVITVAGGGKTSGPGVDANGDERVSAADLVAIATLLVGS